MELKMLETPIKQDFKIINSRQEALFNKINDCIKKDYALFSFDIFDTLITRTTASPQGIFLIMQNELKKNSNIDSFVINNFLNLRINAQNYIYRLKNKNIEQITIQASTKDDFTIYEIYDFLGKNYGLNQEEINSLINLEIETEYKNSLPIKENIELIKYLLSKNKKVVLISDMYLPEKVVRNMLIKHDEIFKDIKIYVSSEYFLKKSSGGLYSVVEKEENIKPDLWLHIGDNKYSDIEVSKKIGIDSFCFENVELLEIEKYFWSEKDKYQDLTFQTVIGASKNTRNSLIDNKQAGFGTLAASILFPYCRWIVETSIKKGIERLYFIARDGYILKLMCDIIIKEFNYNIETQYIYGSRQAWRLPCVDCIEDLVSAFKTYGHVRTFKTIAEMLDISTDELMNFYKANHSITKMVGDHEAVAIYNTLAQNPKFMEYILEKNKNKRKLLIEYLKTLKLNEKNFAFVDLTVSGASNNLLSKLILKEFNLKPCFFHLRTSMKYENKDFVYYDFIQKYTHPFVEYFCRAPHGQTMEYEERNGKIIPILDNTEIADNFEDYEEGIKLCAKLIAKTQNTNKLENDLSIFYSYSQYIETQADEEIIKYIGKVPFSLFGVKKEYSMTKEKFNLLSAIRYFYFKKENNLFEQKLNYTISNSSLGVKLLAAFFRKFPKINHPLIKRRMKHTIMSIKYSF